MDKSETSTTTTSMQGVHKGRYRPLWVPPDRAEDYERALAYTKAQKARRPRSMYLSMADFLLDLSKQFLEEKPPVDGGT